MVFALGVLVVLLLPPIPKHPCKQNATSTNRNNALHRGAATGRIPDELQGIYLFIADCSLRRSLNDLIPIRNAARSRLVLLTALIPTRNAARSLLRASHVIWSERKHSSGRRSSIHRAPLAGT